MTSTILFLAAAMGSPVASGDTVVIANVTVIDMTGASPRPGMTVVIAGGRIRSVRAATPDESRTSPVVDGTGKFLIPGLWDMHTHIWDREMLFPIYLAHGITGIRDMGSPLARWLEWRRDIAAGRVAGPRSVLAGPIVDGFRPFSFFFIQLTSPAEARDSVRALRDRGADFIKVYDRLEREVYLAIAAEASRLGLPFAGHVPFGVKASEAARLGQRSIEHLAGVALECSPAEDSLRSAALGALRDAHADGLSNQEAGARLGRAYDLTRKDALAGCTVDRAQALFQVFRNHRTWHVPTLVVREDAGEEDLTSRLRGYFKYFPDYVHAMILPQRESTPAEREAARQRFQQKLDLVGAMFAAGVRILAGSDAPNPYSVPGLGLHHELAFLVQAGLTPGQALQAATRDAAEFAGQLDSLGTLEAGKVADLVLLDADPLADIRNSEKIFAVVQGGRLLDRASLNAMLRALEERTAPR